MSDKTNTAAGPGRAGQGAAGLGCAEQNVAARDAAEQSLAEHGAAEQSVAVPNDAALLSAGATELAQTPGVTEPAPTAPSPAATAPECPHHAHGPHDNEQEHHHHTHASNSAHPGHHHLLSVEHLSVSFSMYDTTQPFFSAGKRDMCAIDDLTVSVHQGEILAVVGASGSGKSLLADSVMGLFEPNATVRGTIWFDGEQQDARGLAELRGNGISLVPQSVDHLDPMMRVGRQVEGFARRGRSRSWARERRRELFERYKLPQGAERLYPHELSGGMARRVLLCCALMDEPRLIVADEPTPGLDLPLAVAALQDFRAFADAGGGVLFITHDIELALQVADRLAVFKDGAVVEETSVASFKDPALLRHPFSRALWHALPEHDFAACDATAAEEGEAGAEEALSSHSAPDPESAPCGPAGLCSAVPDASSVRSEEPQC